MQFRLSIDCDGDSFSGEPGIEIARILRDVISRLDTLESGDRCYWKLFDFNGNHVGEARFDEPGEPKMPLVVVAIKEKLSCEQVAKMDAKAREAGCRILFIDGCDSVSITGAAEGPGKYGYSEKIGEYSSHVFCQTWEELKEAMALQNSISIDDARANPGENTPESSKYADRNDDSQ